MAKLIGSRKTLLWLVENHNANIKRRIGIDYTFSTYQKYDILYKKLSAFILKKYGEADLPLAVINYSFAAEFDFYLRSVDGNKHNTVAKYIINLKRVFNHAALLGIVQKNPIASFKATYKDVDRIYLSLSELTLIRNKKFQKARLNRTRDLFIFQCFTGLAYSDMALLTSESMSLGVDNSQWLFIRRRKTDVRSAIPLLPQALSVLKKYSVETSKYLLPCYAIQKYNEYLHEIAVECNLNKNLTSHVGRRTFATTIALTNGVSIETVSKILGPDSFWGTN